MATKFGRDCVTLRRDGRHCMGCLREGGRCCGCHRTAAEIERITAIGKPLAAALDAVHAARKRRPIEWPEAK